MTDMYAWAPAYFWSFWNLESCCCWRASIRARCDCSRCASCDANASAAEAAEPPEGWRKTLAGPGVGRTVFLGSGPRTCCSCAGADSVADCRPDAGSGRHGMGGAIAICAPACAPAHAEGPTHGEGGIGLGEAPAQDGAPGCGLGGGCASPEGCCAPAALAWLLAIAACIAIAYWYWYWYCCHCCIIACCCQ